MRPLKPVEDHRQYRRTDRDQLRACIRNYREVYEPERKLFIQLRDWARMVTETEADER